MEFFIPGLAILLLIAIVVFLVLPRIGAPILAVLSLALLAYGLNSHISMFYSEYRYSTWQEKLKAYGPFLIIGFLLLSVLGYMGFLFSIGSGGVLPASNMPAITGVLNATRANSPGGIGSSVINSVGLGANKNRGLANLGGILTTPASRR